MNVLIVGAGPTGLTAAVELARQGFVPTIIDQRLEPSGLSRAVGISTSSLRLLAPSGVTEKLLQAGPALQGICGYFNDKLLLSLNFSEHLPHNDHDAFYPPLHCLPQDQTEAILTSRFRELGGEVGYGIAFVKLEQNDLSVAVTTTSEKAEYDFVIGADGIQSLVRQQLAVAFNGYELDEPWSVADVETSHWQHPQQFSAFLKSNGEMCVAAPIGKNRVRFVSNTADALNTLPINVNVHNIRRQSTFTISVRQAAEYSVGRVHLAGDAAHCHSPVGGRGMNLGIADATQLASCLINNSSTNYHQLRYEHASKTISITERGRRLLSSDNKLSTLIKPTAMKFVNQSSFIKRRFVKSMLDD